MSNRNDRQRGTALVMAIGVLGIAMALGVVYVTYMQNELESANYELRKSRARAIAEGGVQATLARLSQAVTAKQPGALLGTPQTIKFPAFELAFRDGKHEIQPNSGRTAEAKVSVSDESGKVNLNCAPPAVLQAVLNVNAATAQKIHATLHKPGNREWLGSINDLAVRELMPVAQVAALDSSTITTVSVADPAKPEAYLNINAAPVDVLAAILGISKEAAGIVAAKRPFASVDALLQAAGKPPVDPNAPVADSPLAGLVFEPQCFRVASEGSYASNGQGGKKYDRANSRIEAVALFRPDGGYDVIEWKAVQQ